MPAEIAFLIASALGGAIVKVLNKFVDDGLLDPAVGWFKSLVQSGFDERQEAEKLHQTVLDALDDLRAVEPDAIEHFFAVSSLTGLSNETRLMLAAAAVEMTRPDPAIVPAALLSGLGLDETRREWLARFLFLLRKRLAENERYAPAIAYADDLDRSGKLSGITLKMGEMAADLKAILTVNQALLRFRNLTTDERAASEQYLAELRTLLADLPLPLARKSAAGPRRATLRHVFVPLTLRDRRAEEAYRLRSEKRSRLQDNLLLTVGDLLAEEDARLRSEKRSRSRDTMETELREDLRPVGLREVLERYPAFILIGPPGSGKTTSLRWIGLAFAEGRAIQDLDWPQAPKLFPVYARLRNFAAFLQNPAHSFSGPGHGALTAYIDTYYRTERSVDLTADFFEKRLREGNCLVLLDGLDEVSDGREDVAQQVDEFIRYYEPKGNRFGLGSRPKGFEMVEHCLRGAELAVCEVNPLPPDKIRLLIANLFEIIEPDAHKRESDTQKLSGRILAAAELTDLASNPLFCTALVQVYKYHGAELPQRRVDVFQEVVDLLLGFWKAQDEVDKATELAQEDGTGYKYRELPKAVEAKRARLCMLADVMQRTRRADLSHADAVPVLVKYLQARERVKDPAQAETWSENFLYNSSERSGLLIEIEPGVYTFWHQYFREYLAALALINRGEQNFLHDVIEHAQDDWWENVIWLAGAHENTSETLRARMVNALLDQAQASKIRNEPQKRLRCLHVAGLAARDMADRLPGPEIERVEEALKAARHEPSLQPELRAAAADTLDALGHLPEDLYQLVRISGGFWIARYPITNAQYERFLSAADYAREEYWTDLPVFGGPNEGYKRLEPVDGREYCREQPAYWSNPIFGLARKGVPVVGVTWYEASAFCRWLQANWNELACAEWKAANPTLDLRGMQIRLPTEVERPAVLTPDPIHLGEENLPYPWSLPDDHLDSQEEVLRRANVYESGIGRTTPVDMYPLGASQPYGLLNMAGNVWEWHANYYGKDHDNPALRDGSWFYGIRLAHLSFRRGNFPDSGWFDVGFRVGGFPT